MPAGAFRYGLLFAFCVTSSSAVAATIFQNRTPDATADTALLDAPLRSYRALNVDLPRLRAQLAGAPDESSGEPAAEIDLPTADGGTQQFSVWRTQVMAPALAARYPQIRSYVARASAQGGVEARIDDSPHGVAAMIRAPEGVTMLQPVQLGQGSRYIVFRRSEMGRAAQPFQCHVKGDTRQSTIVPQALQTVTGATIRTYRLALAATGEYTQFFGGTVADGLAAMVQAVNRVNGIYLTDFAVQFQLVDNDDLLVFTDPDTDPYTNDHGDAMLAQNQTTVDTIIGAANYDMGHVFSTGGGGVAQVGVACDTSGYKAQGVTGLPAPTGDAFWVDYVAHEMGHQMGALHSFNTTDGACGGGNRTASQAAEPGSGSTIMAYAGICSPSDLQPHSDAFFHAISLTPIVDRLAAGGGTCGSTTTSTNHAPIVEAVAAHTIPAQTPFFLTGAATDADGDTLTYEWDAMNHGAASPPEGDDGRRALFRSFTPQTSGTRLFPELPRILAHDLSVGIPPNGDIPGETWPTQNRTLSFRLTVRDNHPGGGATANTDTTVTVVAAAGPFRITAPTSTATWIAYAPQTVTWNVANTTAAPVSCAAVDILYSGDGGITFDTTLASDVPNSGAATLTAPAAATTHARVQVLCHDNIFFDISPGDFVVLSDEIFADRFDGS